MNGIGYLIDFLQKKQVEVIFGYPGNAVLPLYEELQKSPLYHCMMRHEQGAVHAAEGYAKATGRVGVCLATSGPGATNLITGLCDAMLDSVPLVAITGQVQTSLIGHDAFQEADVMGMTIPVTKHNFLVKDVLSLPTVLEEAWRIALSGRPGPVLVDIPCDVMCAELTKIICAPKLPREREEGRTFDALRNRILRVLNTSFRPVLLVGGGAVGNDAGKKLVRFAEKYSLPIVYTMMGKAALAGRHKNVLGMVGVHGKACANRALYQSDLVVAVGCRFSDRTVPNPILFSETRAVIHVDIDPAELSKNVRAAVTVVSDASDFADRLLALPILEEKNASWQTWFEDLLSQTEIDASDEKLTMAFSMGVLDTMCGEFRTVTDVGQHQVVAANHMHAEFSRGFLTSGGLGTMGFGLPAAIGASFAKDRKPIVLITGDGSFQMCLQELSVVSALSLPVKIFLFCNKSLGLVRQGHEIYFGGDEHFCSLADVPNFLKIAEAYRIKGYVFDKKDNFENAVSSILGEEGPTLTVLYTDENEQVPFWNERSIV